MTDFEQFLWGMLARHPLETLDPFTLSQAEPAWAPMCLERFKAPEDVLIFVWQSAHEHVVTMVTPGTQGKDYVFDYLMGMADYLTPYKEVTRSLASQMVKSPCMGMRLAPFAAHWAEMVLTGAGLRTEGLRSIMERYSFVALALWLFYQWLGDDTPDLSPTMVAVDNALQKWLKFRDFPFG